MLPNKRIQQKHWERIDVYSGPEQFLATYSAAPEVPRVLFVAHFCESEVGNGGFHQFFSNPTGVLAPEVAAAYRRLGLPDLAEIVEEAMAFWGTPYPRDQGDRQDRLVWQPPKPRQEWDPFFALDERFYASCGCDANGVYSGTRLYDALDVLPRAGGPPNYEMKRTSPGRMEARRFSQCSADHTVRRINWSPMRAERDLHESK